MKVIEFKNLFVMRPDDAAFYLLTFEKEYVPISFFDLPDLNDLSIVDDDDSEWAQTFRLTVNPNLFVVIEDELHYLRRIVRDKDLAIGNLKASVSALRQEIADIREQTCADVIHQFMPHGYRGERYLSSHNKTPYRRGIANALFFLYQRGYTIPSDCVPFMERYKTRKRISRRKSK